MAMMNEDRAAYEAPEMKGIELSGADVVRTSDIPVPPTPGDNNGDGSWI